MKRTITTAIGLLLMLGACEGLPNTETASQATTSPPTPPRPISARPGSLGGVCGINFTGCPTGSITTQIFRSLPRSAIEVPPVAISWSPTVPVGRFRGITWTLWVGRLVNDHAGPMDKITVSWSEGDYGATFPNSGANQLSFARNGYPVAFAVASQIPVSVGKPLQPTYTVDYTRGGAETLLAWYSTPGVDATMRDFIKASHGKLASIGEGVPSDCKVWMGDCFQCKFGRYSTVGLLAGIGAGISVLSGGAALVTIGAATAGGALGTWFTDAFNCDNTCKQESCTEEACACFHRYQNATLRAGCESTARMCCENAAGHYFGGGKCW